MAAGDPKIDTVDPWGGNKITLSTPDDPTPTLYHADLSYYSQVTRIVLEEEGVNYNSRLTDIQGEKEQLAPWFLNMNPEGTVPCMMYKGEPKLESKDIALFVIEEISPSHTLLPVEAEEKIKALVERHYNECHIEKASMCGIIANSKLMAMGVPRATKGALKKIEGQLKEHPEQAEELNKKKEKIERRLKMFENPKDNLNAALNQMEGVLDELEKNLSETEFICGDKYTLADCLFTCMLGRLNMIGTDILGFALSSRPKLAQWWEVVQKRPSFKNAGIKSEPLSASTIMKRICVVM